MQLRYGCESKRTGHLPSKDCAIDISFTYNLTQGPVTFMSVAERFLARLWDCRDPDLNIWPYAMRTL